LSPRAAAPPHLAGSHRAGQLLLAGEDDRPSWPDFREKGEEIGLEREWKVRNEKKNRNLP